ncbi:MAG: ABC transporter ATP-binding protein [Planctomycetota bacterium]
MRGTEDVLVADRLTIRFRKRTVLDALSLRLTPGVVTVLLGENGAGKSTLMRLALGVLKPSGGTLRVLGHDPMRRARAVRERVGYVPDVPDAYDWMTPRQFYRYLAPQYPGWDGVRAVARAVELAVPLDERFADLSRGQGMKAMLVAALASSPELLLLDEPFAGLDPLVRDEVLRGVIAGLRDEGRTVLCATHDLEVAARIADRVAVLSQGRIVADGTVEEVLGHAEPANVPEQLRAVLAASAG